MKYSPRPYQKKAVDAVLSRFKSDSTKLLLHLPTGAGKTIIAILIIEKLLALSDTDKILVTVHGL